MIDCEFFIDQRPLARAPRQGSMAFWEWERCIRGAPTDEDRQAAICAYVAAWDGQDVGVDSTLDAIGIAPLLHTA